MAVTAERIPSVHTVVGPLAAPPSVLITAWAPVRAEARVASSVRSVQTTSDSRSAGEKDPARRTNAVTSCPRLWFCYFVRHCFLRKAKS